LTVTYDGMSASVIETRLLNWISTHPGYIAAIESTFESYDPVARNECITMAVEKDVQLWTYNPRTTRARRREEAARTGEDEDDLKSDELDALWIWRTAFETPAHPKVPTAWVPPTPEGLYDRWALNYPLVAMRRSEYQNDDARRLKVALRHRLYLARYDIQQAMFDGRQMLDYFVLPVALVAEQVLMRGGSRKDFDRRIGAYSHGYPSLIRSNIYHHRVAALVGRGMERKEAMRRCRLATRRIFYEVRRAGEDGQTRSRDGQRRTLIPPFAGEPEQEALPLVTLYLVRRATGDGQVRSRDGQGRSTFPSPAGDPAQDSLPGLDMPPPEA